MQNSHKLKKTTTLVNWKAVLKGTAERYEMELQKKQCKIMNLINILSSGCQTQKKYVLHASIYMKIKNRKNSPPSLAHRILGTLGNWVGSIWKCWTGWESFWGSNNDLTLDLCASYMDKFILRKFFILVLFCMYFILKVYTHTHKFKPW